MYRPLSFILSFVYDHSTKIRVLIDLFLLFVHDHSTKVKNYSYVSFALFLAVVPLYFVRYIHSSTTLIFPTLYSLKCCSYISYAISMAIWSLNQHLVQTTRSNDCLPKEIQNIQNQTNRELQIQDGFFSDVRGCSMFSSVFLGINWAHNLLNSEDLASPKGKWDYLLISLLYFCSFNSNSQIKTFSC